MVQGPVATVKFVYVQDLIKIQYHVFISSPTRGIKPQTFQKLKIYNFLKFNEEKGNVVNAHTLISVNTEWYLTEDKKLIIIHHSFIIIWGSKKWNFSIFNPKHWSAGPFWLVNFKLNIHNVIEENFWKICCDIIQPWDDRFKASIFKIKNRYELLNKNGRHWKRVND